MISIRRQHRLGLAKARRLAENITERLQKEYGGSYAWSGNDLQFRRTGVSGSVAVTKEDVRIRVEVGLLLRPLQRVIEREIQTFCDEHFGAPDHRETSEAQRPSSAPRRPRTSRGQ